MSTLDKIGVFGASFNIGWSYIALSVGHPIGFMCIGIGVFALVLHGRSAFNGD